MDRQKLIEDTIEIDKVNKDGKVFERGIYVSINLCSFKNISPQQSKQACYRTRHQHRDIPSWTRQFLQVGYRVKRKCRWQRQLWCNPIWEWRQFLWIRNFSRLIWLCDAWKSFQVLAVWRWKENVSQHITNS